MKSSQCENDMISNICNKCSIDESLIPYIRTECGVQNVGDMSIMIDSDDNQLYGILYIDDLDNFYR